MMDLQKCCDFFDKNVGRRVFIKIRESVTDKVKKFEGIVESGFNHDPSPVSMVKTKKTIKEIFLGEVITAEVVG